MSLDHKAECNRLRNILKKNMYFRYVFENYSCNFEPLQKFQDQNKPTLFTCLIYNHYSFL